MIATALVILGCLVIGSGSGLIVAWLRIRRSKSKWVLAGQRQAELTHGTWSPAVSPTAWNPPEVPLGRHRSPDGKAVKPEPMPPRPVFERPDARTR